MLAYESICIGKPSATESYLNIPRIIAAAEVTNSVAIHPGYGFLAENAEFAEAVEKSGFVFVGPKAETITLMGDKVSAINASNFPSLTVYQCKLTRQPAKRVSDPDRRSNARQPF